MSQGGFIQSFYETDTGEICNVTIEEQTPTLEIGGVANTAPTGPADSDQVINISRGRKSKGVNARLVRFRVTNAGTSGLKLNSTIALPWLDPGTFLTVTRPGRQTGTYRDGSEIQVVGGSPETFVSR